MSRDTCRTPGARYQTVIGESGVTVHVDLPASVAITMGDATRLEQSIHDALEDALAPLFEAAP